MNARAKHLLKVLVESYIRDGLPVGSRTLACESGLDISSATVRSVMAELEERGLVASPHTSAGRVPTDKAYRLFIDSLSTFEQPHQREVERLRSVLGGDVSIQTLAVSVSALLSGVSSMAGVVMLPRREKMILRHIELVPMSGQRVLALLVVNGQEVHSSVITTDRAFIRAELGEAANYLNSVFAGRDLADIRAGLLNDLRATQADMDRVVYAAMRMAEKVFAIDANDEDIVVSGQTNLMEFEELSDLEKLRVLFETFNEKRKILHLLDQCLHTGGVQVVLGKESGFSVLDDCSLVTSTYTVDGSVIGVLGVIGPMRMSYRRVIPLVDMTAKMVSAALNQPH